MYITIEETGALTQGIVGVPVFVLWENARCNEGRIRGNVHMDAPNENIGFSP